MSKITTNPEVETFQPDFPQKAGKGAATIVFSIILMLLSIASLFVSKIGDEMLFEVLFAFPPFVTEGPASAILYCFATYAYFATAIFGLIFAIVALAKHTNTLPVFSKGYGILACGALVFTLSMEFEAGSLLLAIATLAIGSVAAFREKGKTATIYVLQAVLTIAAFALVAIGLGKSTDEAGIVLVFGLALATVAVALACLRLDAKGVVFEFIRASLTLIGTAIALLNGAGIYAVLAVVIAIIQIVITILQLRARNKAAIRKAAEEIESTFHIEEYAEAFTYEGGPVADVRMAEEVNPTAMEVPHTANTAGYDFYNSKAFDPFIATLSETERKQFTELFILKYKGVMPEIPDYEVGGENKEFFHKVFIYLGQYRDRIPNGLLVKIYQYTLKRPD